MYHKLKYLYYRIYTWQLNLWGEADVPEFTGAIGVSILLYVNIFTIIIIFEIISGSRIINSLVYPRLYIAIFLLITFYINYLLFVRKSKYIEIANEFRKEGKALRKKRTIWMWVYIIGTLMTFFISLHISNLLIK